MSLAGVFTDIFGKHLVLFQFTISTSFITAMSTKSIASLGSVAFSLPFVIFKTFQIHLAVN